MKISSWVPVLDEYLSKKAIAIAINIGNRLKNPQEVINITHETLHRYGWNEGPSWRPIGLAYGFSGYALFYGHLNRCFPNNSWDKVAHEYINLAVEAINNDQKWTLGLFHGLCGLGFAVYYNSNNGNRYTKLLSKLNDLFISSFNSLELPLTHANVSSTEYDLISGLNGICVYLMQYPEVFCMRSKLLTIIDTLLDLAKIKDGTLGFSSPYTKIDKYLKTLYPEGVIDFGIAHGVPGSLAILALAKLKGYFIPTVDISIRALANWIILHRYTDRWGLNWPYYVSANFNSKEDYQFVKSAWCYGAAGIANALWLAGKALNNRKLMMVSLKTVSAIERREDELSITDSPILCHGVAGIVQIVLRIMNQTGYPYLHCIAEIWAKRLINLFDPDCTVGFKDRVKGRQIEDSDLLNGAVGIALSLLAASTSVEPVWDQILLLS